MDKRQSVHLYILTFADTDCTYAKRDGQAELS